MWFKKWSNWTTAVGEKIRLPVLLGIRLGLHPKSSDSLRLRLRNPDNKTIFGVASPTQLLFTSKRFKDLSPYMLRDSLNVQIPPPLRKKNFYFKSYFRKATSLWNALPVVAKVFLPLNCVCFEAFYCGPKKMLASPCQSAYYISTLQTRKISNIDFYIWYFPINVSVEKCFFLVSSWQNSILPLLASSWKNANGQDLEKSFRRPRWYHWI